MKSVKVKVAICQLAFSLGFSLILAGCGNPSNFNVKTNSEESGNLVAYNTKMDVLFVVDNSSSMAQHQNTLSNQAGVFVDYLLQNKFDFHLAVTTTDVGASGEQGAFVGITKVLTKDTPNVKSQFMANVLVGQNGSDLERGLQAMQMALQPAMLNGVNQGFYRADALLAIVVLSDEDDGSANSSGSYGTFLESLKPQFPWGYKGWIFNSIVVQDINGTCRTFNQYAAAGYRYMDLSNASGGSIDSICSTDFSSALKNLRARITERMTEVHLSKKPNVSTLRVWINGVLIAENSSNGWTYDPNGYVIRFHGTSLPPAGAVVRVDYKPDLN